MTSTDIFTVANSEQEFRVYVITKLDANDKRLDGIEARLDGIETEQKAQRTAIQGVQTELRVTNGKLDMMQHMVYWGVALLGLFLGFVAWMRPRDSKPEPQSMPSRWELEGMIRDVVREMLPHVNS